MLEVVCVVDTPTGRVAKSNIAKPTSPLGFDELFAWSAIRALFPLLEFPKLMAHKTLASVASFEPHGCVPPHMLVPQNFI